MAVLVYAALAAGIFGLDLFLKNHIEQKMKEGEEKSLCKGMFLIRKYHNKGAFLDIGEKRQKVVAILSLSLTLFMSVVFLTTFSFRGNAVLKAGLAFLLGGAYSNTYDRLTRNYVVDYVSFPVKNRRLRQVVFNISDFCIIIGALMMTLGESSKFRS
ncbi:MAG: signal peptidase II [Lachnospiraceae bacterium]|nr:signal peptidase II [Lachnospiraceae bacterium]